MSRNNLICVVLLLMAECAWAAPDSVFTIAHDATLSRSIDCSRTGAWPSLEILKRAGCLAQGGTIVFAPGVYRSDQYFFAENMSGGLGHINLMGSEQYPITLTSSGFNRSENIWPVRFEGKFVIYNSRYLTIRGIDFQGETAQLVGHSVLGIGGAQHIELDQVRIRGYASGEGFEPSDKLSGDCIKIDGGDDLTEHIAVRNSEVAYCNEDVMDVTGRRHIVFEHNHLHHARFLQIKGGSEHVRVEHNRIHDMMWGVKSGGMDCSTDSAPKYCGNPQHVSIPVSERFQGNDIRVANNHISNIRLGQGVMPSGWRNVQIVDNTFVNAALVIGSYVIQFPEHPLSAATAYFDQAAHDYCAQYPEECGPCFAPISQCKRVKLRSFNVTIQNNTFIYERAANNENTALNAFYLNSAQVTDRDSICLQGNQFIKPDDIRVQFHADIKPTWRVHPEAMKCQTGAVASAQPQ